MIKLSKFATQLQNLPNTINAIKDLDNLINHYNEIKPGPAYCTFDTPMGPIKVQLDRAIAVQALQEKRNRLCSYLAELGIEVDT